MFKINDFFLILLFTILVVLIFLNFKKDSFENQEKIPKNIYVKLLWGICNRLRTIRKLYAYCLDNNINLYIIDNKTYNDTEKNAFPISIKELLINIPINIISENEIPKNVNNLINKDNGCECKQPHLKDKYTDNVLLHCCDYLNDKYNNDNRFYKLMEKNITLPNNIKLMIDKIKNNKAIGVHIRQGSVFDYYQKNFFGDKPSKENDEPYFCCFEDSSKNLSYCPKNVVSIEKFINKMNEFPKDKMFYICSDRTGCVLKLLQIFKDRLLYNPIIVHKKEIDIMPDFYDWYCLQFCSEIITTWQSSYSGEASILNNIKRINA